MLVYSALILAAVLAIVPVGRLDFPALQDADQLFLRVMEAQFPPVIRGIAVAAVLAAVMSTTDALLLACSSAIAHDLLGGLLHDRASERTMSIVRIGSTWVIGIVALMWAFSPPELISEFYTAGVGVLSASLFIPTVAGLWWKKANLVGGVGAIVAGSSVYVLVQIGIIDVGLAPVVVALCASAAAMLMGGLFGPQESEEMIGQIEALHR
jgi:Na+/pantothenate symporter